MCVIIHKPRGVRIPERLLAAAASLNRDGWGVMGLYPDGEPVRARFPEVRLEDLCQMERDLRLTESVWHLRRRSHGARRLDNIQPIEVLDDLFLMHSGALRLAPAADGHSDSWQFAVDVLRPLATGLRAADQKQALETLLGLALGEEDRLAILDANQGRISILNRELGTHFEGVWLSGSRWIDQRLLKLNPAPQIQASSVLSWPAALM